MKAKRFFSTVMLAIFIICYPSSANAGIYKILIDNGHGSNTAGKRSPDGTLIESNVNREIASQLVAKLKQQGIDAELLVPEKTDVPLPTRCRRVNLICNRLGANNVLLISIHVNAAKSDGRWHSARGWEGYVAKCACPDSKRLAQLLYAETKKHNLQGNRAVPLSEYWSEDFYILKYTHCPAVLTENLFMDNKAEARYLNSKQGKDDIVQLHLKAILNYLKGK